MQDELELEAPGAIRILSVNLYTAEASVPLMTEGGKDLPVLQDQFEPRIWWLWDVEYRDVVILDAENIPVGVYNLTVHDLSNSLNYEELYAMLLEAAGIEAGQ
jgi:hypothetical protein